MSIDFYTIFYPYHAAPNPPCQDSPANCPASAEDADAADPTPEQLAVLMAPTRSEPSRVQWDGDGQGEVELDVEPPGEWWVISNELDGSWFMILIDDIDGLMVSWVSFCMFLWHLKL